MRERITDYNEWAALARSLGYQGPYDVKAYDVKVGQQFCFERGGTAALWNQQAQTGVVFDDPWPKCEKCGE